MGVIQRFRRAAGRAILGREVFATLETFENLNDPHLKKFIQGAGVETSSGAFVTPETAMRVSAVNASVRLLATTTAMLPLPVYREISEGKKEKAEKLPLYRVLQHKPNAWQTPFQFRSMLSAHMLLRGNGYALKVPDSSGRVRQLIPLHPDRMRVEQNDDLSLVYKWNRRDGRTVTFRQEDIFHLADWYTANGFTGKSRIELEREAIGWTLRAQEAGARQYRNGVMAGGALSTEQKLSETARANIEESLKTKYESAENAGKWLVLEQGLEPKTISPSARDMQFIETMKFQVIDIARVYGVPPHLIGEVEKSTSWGEGISEQTTGYVVFSALPIATAWEQTISRDCISERDRDTLFAKHNMNALLRGAAKEQAEAFAKALGSGGHPAWLSVNEIRDLLELNRLDGDEFDRPAPAMSGDSQNANQETGNEPAQAPED